MIYTFRADDGAEIHIEASMEKPPRFGARKIRDGKVYRRILDAAPPLVAPNIHSKSHQLPSWYGFRDHAAADKYSRSRGRKPNEQDRNRIAAQNAERAGCKNQFDKQGRPIASTRSGVRAHIKRGRDKGDQIVFEGVRE